MTERSETTDRVVSPEVAMAILVYDYRMSGSEALNVVSGALEKERRCHE